LEAHGEYGATEVEALKLLLLAKRKPRLFTCAALTALLGRRLQSAKSGTVPALLTNLLAFSWRSVRCWPPQFVGWWVDASLRGSPWTRAADCSLFCKNCLTAFEQAGAPGGGGGGSGGSGSDGGGEGDARGSARSKHTAADLQPPFTLEASAAQVSDFALGSVAPRYGPAALQAAAHDEAARRVEAHVGQLTQQGGGGGGGMRRLCDVLMDTAVVPRCRVVAAQQLRHWLESPAMVVAAKPLLARVVHFTASEGDEDDIVAALLLRLQLKPSQWQLHAEALGALARVRRGFFAQAARALLLQLAEGAAAAEIVAGGGGGAHNRGKSKAQEEQAARLQVFVHLFRRAGQIAGAPAAATAAAAAAASAPAAVATSGHAQASAELGRMLGGLLCESKETALPIAVATRAAAALGFSAAKGIGFVSLCSAMLPSPSAERAPPLSPAMEVLCKLQRLRASALIAPARPPPTQRAGAASRAGPPSKQAAAPPAEPSPEALDQISRVRLHVLSWLGQQGTAAGVDLECVVGSSVLMLKAAGTADELEHVWSLVPVRGLEQLGNLGLHPRSHLRLLCAALRRAAQAGTASLDASASIAQVLLSTVPKLGEPEPVSAGESTWRREQLGLACDLGGDAEALADAAVAGLVLAAFNPQAVADVLWSNCSFGRELLLRALASDWREPGVAAAREGGGDGGGHGVGGAGDADAGCELPLSVLQHLGALDRRLGLGARLRQSRDPHLPLRVVTNNGPMARRWVAGMLSAAPQNVVQNLPPSHLCDILTLAHAPHDGLGSSLAEHVPRILQRLRVHIRHGDEVDALSVVFPFVQLLSDPSAARRSMAEHCLTNCLMEQGGAGERQSAAHGAQAAAAAAPLWIDTVLLLAQQQGRVLAVTGALGAALMVEVDHSLLQAYLLALEKLDSAQDQQQEQQQHEEQAVAGEAGRAGGGAYSLAGAVARLLCGRARASCALLCDAEALSCVVRALHGALLGPGRGGRIFAGEPQCSIRFGGAAAAVQVPVILVRAAARLLALDLELPAELERPVIELAECLLPAAADAHGGVRTASPAVLNDDDMVGLATGSRWAVAGALRALRADAPDFSAMLFKLACCSSCCPSSARHVLALLDSDAVAAPVPTGSVRKLRLRTMALQRCAGSSTAGAAFLAHLAEVI
jgi:hypothetical protein